MNESLGTSTAKLQVVKLQPVQLENPRPNLLARLLRALRNRINPLLSELVAFTSHGKEEL